MASPEADQRLFAQHNAHWIPKGHPGAGNILVFNNGFHTVHHENAGAHWSLLPALHAKIAHEIDPAPQQQSIFGFCLRSYLLGALSDRFRTKRLARAPYDPPDGQAIQLVTASVPAAEAGVNASAV